MQILETNTGALIQMDAGDVESAIRHFICACHPKFSAGFVVNPVAGHEIFLQHVAFEAVRSAKHPGSCLCPQCAATPPLTPA